MDQSQVHVVTNAPVGHAEDLRRRQRNYVILMSTRTICFLCAALLPVPLMVKFGFAFGALVLPYLAVVVANAGRERGSSAGTLLAGPMPPLDVPALGPGPSSDNTPSGSRNAPSA